MDFPRKILAIRLSSIGDIILTTPLFRIIKKVSPESELHVITKKEFSSLLANNPNIDRLFLFDSNNGSTEIKKWKTRFRKEQYDFIADLHNNIRSLIMSADYPPSKIRRLKKYKRERFLLVHFKENTYRFIRPVAQRYIDVFRPWELIDDRIGAELFWPDEVKQKIDNMFQDLDQFTAIAPGAYHETKRWPLDRFCHLADKIYEHNRKPIVFFGGPGESVYNEKMQNLLKIPYINLMGKLKLSESAYLLSKASLLISNDTGLMHMAGAVKTPVVAIFGSTVKELGFFPYRNKHNVMEILDLKCRPCSHIGRSKCPQKHFSCMKDISIEMVFQAAKKIIEETTDK